MLLRFEKCCSNNNLLLLIHFLDENSTNAHSVPFAIVIKSTTRASHFPSNQMQTLVMNYVFQQHQVVNKLISSLSPDLSSKTYFITDCSEFLNSSTHHVLVYRPRKRLWKYFFNSFLLLEKPATLTAIVSFYAVTFDKKCHLCQFLLLSNLLSTGFVD